MPTISIPFVLPDVTILAVYQRDAETLCLTVASTILGTKGRQCRRWITQYHGPDRPIELRHLSMGGTKRSSESLLYGIGVEPVIGGPPPPNACPGIPFVAVIPRRMMPPWCSKPYSAGFSRIRDNNR